MKTVKLNNGIEMPAIGLGTFMMKPAEAEEAVYNALKCGYRLIDTANAYMNERAVGRGRKNIFRVKIMANSIHKGNSS